MSRSVTHTKKEGLAARVNLEARRDELVALLPDAIKAIASCIRKPGRNSQTQLAAAKTVLDRAGLPIIAATEIRPPAGQEALQISVRFVDPPKQEK